MTRRNLIILESRDGEQKRGIQLIDGPRPYLWIGPFESGPTFGVVLDRDVRKLKRYCERVIAAKSRHLKPKRKEL